MCTGTMTRGLDAGLVPLTNQNVGKDTHVPSGLEGKHAVTYLHLRQLEIKLRAWRGQGHRPTQNLEG